jgi:chemotaxis signal transduction protein
MLVFRLGDHQLALPAHQVAAVTAVAGCTPIPAADPTLLGVARVDDRVLPLIDAHGRMRIAGRPPGALPWTCLVVKGPLGDVVFRIDEVLGLRTVPDGLAPPGCALMPIERLGEGDVAAGREAS